VNHHLRRARNETVICFAAVGAMDVEPQRPRLHDDSDFWSIFRLCESSDAHLGVLAEREDRRVGKVQEAG
jgi:hypothetical protein